MGSTPTEGVACRTRRGWCMPAETRSGTAASSIRPSAAPPRPLYPTLDAFARRDDGDAKYRAVRYGACGVANTFALADAAAELEGGAGAVVTSTGLSAVTLALTALMGHDDHVLMTDSA